MTERENAKETVDRILSRKRDRDADSDAKQPTELPAGCSPFIDFSDSFGKLIRFVLLLKVLSEWIVVDREWSGL
jgi:hypothetical protein